MMTISADALLSYILVAVGGFFIKYLWDALVKKGEQTTEKAKNYDEQKMKDTIESIIKESCDTFRKEITISMNDFQLEAKSTFDYWQKKYWEAVDHLGVVEKDFLLLREQNLLFYRYQLINACKKYLSQGSMTQNQFDQLSELHKIYNALGGNSQGDLYYNKTLSLPINNDIEDDFEDFELHVTSKDMRTHENKKNKENEI